MPIRIKRTDDGKQFYFRVTAKNGKILDPSEPHKNKSDIRKGIDALTNELNNPRLVIIDETEAPREKKERKKREAKPFVVTPASE